MLTQQYIIQELNRKVALLDQYASTLERENLAKNNQTETLYTQLMDTRNQNDILRSHLSRINQQNIERMRRQQTHKSIQKKNHSVNSSVELQHIQQKENQSISQVEKVNFSCQTQFEEPIIDASLLHHTCTQEITKLLSTISEKDSKHQQITKESQQMYDSIVHLQEENDLLRKQLIEVQTKFRTQSKQFKSYQIEIEQLRNALNEQRQAFENQRKNMQTQRDNNNAAEHQIQRLIRDNNRLIQKIRMLEKEKNSFYAQLRGRNVSPLKSSQISSRQNIQNGMKPSFTGGMPYSSEQKPQPQRFSSQFGIGKQKQKVKAQRWRKIEEKINQVKQENEQLRANLTIV